MRVSVFLANGVTKEFTNPISVEYKSGFVVITGGQVTHAYPCNEVHEVIETRGQHAPKQSENQSPLRKASTV